MKNTAAYYQNTQAIQNGGCGRMMFQRTETGQNRICGINGKCEMCRKKAAAR